MCKKRANHPLVASHSREIESEKLRARVTMCRASATAAAFANSARRAFYKKNFRVLPYRTDVRVCVAQWHFCLYTNGCNGGGGGGLQG